MEFDFEGGVVEWRGPAPFYFVAIPEAESADIKAAAKGIEYWGQVPVTVCIRDAQFSTALFPRDGRYLLGSGLEFDDRGDHELKGVPGTWRLYAVRS